MKHVTLIYNPTAGNEEHSSKKLATQIESAGFACTQYSTKEEGWQQFDENTDIIAIAGGDGTVRKVIKELLKKKKQFQIGLLPLGTANNIAKTLGVNGNIKQIIRSWKTGTVKKVDIGTLVNFSEASFFLEGFGFGIFPYLVKEIKDRGIKFDTPEEELKGALKLLHKILLSYEPHKCHLEIDGTDHSGNFFMVEVMNIRSIGPNLMLAPYADPGDGELDVILVPEAHKEKFADFLLQKLTGEEEEYQFHTLKAKQIKILYDGKHLHADDKILKLKKETEILIEITAGCLEFFITA